MIIGNINFEANPKQRYQWPHKKDLCRPNIYKKSNFETYFEVLYPFLVLDSCRTFEGSSLFILGYIWWVIIGN